MSAGQERWRERERERALEHGPESGDSRHRTTAGCVGDSASSRRTDENRSEELQMKHRCTRPVLSHLPGTVVDS